MPLAPSVGLVPTNYRQGLQFSCFGFLLYLTDNYMLLLYNLYGIDFCNFLLGFCKEKKEKEQKASVRPQA